MSKSPVKARREQSLLALFIAIWDEREHVSFISGKPIYTFSVSNFAHVLPRGRFPKMKFERDNIVLLLPEEHFLLDQGTIKQREEYAKKNPTVKWDMISELKDKLLNDYSIL